MVADILSMEGPKNVSLFQVLDPPLSSLIVTQRKENYLFAPSSKTVKKLR